MKTFSILKNTLTFICWNRLKGEKKRNVKGMLKHQEEVPKCCALKKVVSLFGRLTGPERGEPLALGNHHCSSLPLPGWKSRSPSIWAFLAASPLVVSMTPFLVYFFLLHKQGTFEFPLLSSWHLILGFIKAWAWGLLFSLAYSLSPQGLRYHL